MLKFNEYLHQYTLGDRPLVSVSQIVESQFRPFNATIISGVLAKTKAQDPLSPYFGMDQTAIQTQWVIAGREAREKGTTLHKAIECFFEHGNSPNPEPPEWKQFLKFAQDHPQWICIATEHRVFNHYAAGTIDAVFDTPEGVVLVDWKRCKAIDYAGHGQGRDMMKHVADCNYSKYSLQLSLYKQLIGCTVANCYIIQFHPDNESYRKLRAQDFYMEASALLKWKD